MKHYAALALCGMLWMTPAWALEDKQDKAAQPQIDFYTTNDAGLVKAGGALGIPVFDFKDVLKSGRNFPLYARAGLSMTSTGARATLGGDLMTPWFLCFRGQIGSGLEVDAHSTYAQTTPYIRMGTQLWIFFSDVDFSRFGTNARGGLRLEF